MIHENNLVAVSQFDGNAYKSSQNAELALNAAILRAEIDRSYEEFLDIFERFYADDLEVSSEDSRETMRGKARVRPILMNFLVPLHVMAEVAGLSISVEQTAVPRDTANETHSAWRLDIAGVRGKRCTLKWNAIRRWNGSRVVYEHHYDHQQIGGPLTQDDLNLNLGRSEVRVSIALLRLEGALDRLFRTGGNKQWLGNSRRKTRHWCSGLSTRFSTGETTWRPSDSGHHSTFNTALILPPVVRVCLT